MAEEIRKYFHWADWLVFGLMLTVSAAAGIWQYRRVKKITTMDYLLGGKSMSLVPVSASLIASFISGVTILGTPSEIYNFGTQYWITIISMIMAGLVVMTIYLPVFVKLQLNSVYEYLEIRFSREVRLLISFIFVFDIVLYQSIVIYVPALALNEVSGINIHIIGAVVCGICVFYTVLGGIRAVVWTDTLQVAIMILAMLAVAIIGTWSLDGPTRIWKTAEEMNRIEFFNFDPSLYTRHTVWSVLFGSFFYCASYIAVNQTMVQRYTALKDLKSCQLSIVLFTIGVITFQSICCWCGLVLLAWWAPPKCDPRASGLVAADDQMLPAFVMEIAGNLYGIPGLFISGIFGAALSTLSVGLNSTSVVLLEDFVKGSFKMKPNERCASIFVKSIVVLLGFIALGLVFFVERLGGVLVVTNGLAAIAAGTSFGVFTLGMLFPWSNSKGAFVGTIVGFAIAGWASFGANASVSAGTIVAKKLPVPVDQCPGNVSQAFLDQFIYHNEDDVFPMYRLSYHWVSLIGVLFSIITGLLVSFLTGPRDPASVDINLFSPIIHRWLPKPRTANKMNSWEASAPRGDSNVEQLAVNDKGVL